MDRGVRSVDRVPHGPATESATARTATAASGNLDRGVDVHQTLVAPPTLGWAGCPHRRTAVHRDG